MNIAFIPIDNRPVCYTLPYMISKIDKRVNLIMPARELLGDLINPSKTDKILDFLESLENIDVLILSLDTIAYGGLITSRRTNDSIDIITERLDRLKKIIQGKKVYAFSSIMRISNNNINQEEKEYWNIYGKKIFEYSYNFHKNKITQTDIPQEILNDYLNTRKRNFEINKTYLEWQKQGLFEKLIFSKDDCAEYGLNVLEAQELSNLGGFIKTGADEIPLTLLARAYNDLKVQRIKVYPTFTEPEFKNLVSNYEDISIEECVKAQLELSGCEIADKNNADVILYVNNFKNNQGEIVMKVDTEPFSKTFKIPDKPYGIADVRFANGADNCFVNELLKKGLGNYFMGYSAWNTSANTLGSLICGMCFAYNNDFYNPEFQKLQITRLLDDWAYQANVRQKLKSPDEKLCKKLMKPYEEKIWSLFGTKYKTDYKFTWNRLFEIEVKLS